MRKLNFLWTLVAAVALSMGFASCTNDTDDVDNGGENGTSAEVAYLSLNLVKNTTGTRVDSNEENAEKKEGDVNSLYVLMLDDSNGILVNPSNSARYYVKSGVTSGLTGGLQVNINTKKIVLIVNPNELLQHAIESIDDGDVFSDFNVAINAYTKEVTGTDNDNFTMISTPSDYDASLGSTIDPLIAVTPYSTNSEATNNPVQIVIERLAAKVQVSYDNATITKPAGTVKLEVTGWMLDQTNTYFYPFAKKTLYGDNHVSGYYKYNFYTEDPNYTDANGLSSWDGISTITWLETGKYDYCIENTMSKDAMFEANATRVLLKATYYPIGTTEGGDWFYFDGYTYDGLEALQKAYTKEASIGASPLVAACNTMFDAIVDYLPQETTAFNFTTLSTDDLDNIANGGQLLKNNATDLSLLIYWYQKGLNYYAYEIQHDTNVTGLEYKYGVVHNNYYSLKLTKISGKGTPWTPEPEGEIEKEEKYLAFEVDVANWIFWETEFEL